VPPTARRHPVTRHHQTASHVPPTAHRHPATRHRAATPHPAEQPYRDGLPSSAALSPALLATEADQRTSNPRRIAASRSLVTASDMRQTLASRSRSEPTASGHACLPCSASPAERRVDRSQLFQSARARHRHQLTQSCEAAAARSAQIHKIAQGESLTLAIFRNLVKPRPSADHRSTRFEISKRSTGRKRSEMARIATQKAPQIWRHAAKSILAPPRPRAGG
jgi:hypothetical protein